MNRAIQALALLSLALPACDGHYHFEADYYYDDCYDYYDDCYYYSYSYDGWHPSAVVADDFDGDGRIDLAVGDGRAEAVWLVRGRETGFSGVPDLRLSTRAVPAGVVRYDALGDGGMGLLVLGAATGGLEAFTGDGTGGFLALPSPTAPATLAGSTRFARARIDGDGADDVVYVDRSGGVHVALGTGAGAFVEHGGDPAAAFLGALASSRTDGLHVAVAQFDAERGADLVVVDGENAVLAVFSGRGDGTFGEGRVARFSRRGDVLSVVPVRLEAAGPTRLALLFGEAVDEASESTLAVVDPDDGSLVVGETDVGSARSVAAFDLDGDGASDLLLADPVRGLVRALYLRRR